MSSDDEFNERFQASLRTVPLPPMTTDVVDEAVRAGRRRRWTRHLATSAVAGVAVVTVAVSSMVAIRALRPTVPAPPGPSAAAATTGPCDVRELPLPAAVGSGRRRIDVTNVDPTGRYVTGAVQTDMSYRDSRALLWVDGQVTVLNPSGDGEWANAVNASGTVVGMRYGGDTWMYRDGAFTTLPSLSDDQPIPTAINTRGDIVGTSGERPVIWPADQPNHVRAFGTAEAIAEDVTDDGLIVASTGAEGQLWNSDGTVHSQPTGFQPRLVGGPWVVGADPSTRLGVSPPANSGFVLWNVDTDEQHRLPDGLDPLAVSRSGIVLGEIYVDGRGQPRPVLVRDDTLVRLPEPASVAEFHVTAVTGDGRVVVGDGTKANGDPVALMWTGC